jgi:hypothetical protein
MQLVEYLQNYHPVTGNATQKSCMPKTQNQFDSQKHLFIFDSGSEIPLLQKKKSPEPLTKYKIQRQLDAIKCLGIIYNGC